MIGPPPPTPTDPAGAARVLADLGFLGRCDLPDRPGPASLLVAIRPAPTFRHFDPERVEHWASRDGRGVRRTTTIRSRLPIDEPYSWGLIRVVDRLGVTNEWLSFGGRLGADRVDGAAILVFSSPAPILRRGGHSQGFDEGAESLGAFFGRLLLAVDYVPGFEARLTAADPVERYAAFLVDALDRFRRSPSLRIARPGLERLLDGEAARLRAAAEPAWLAGRRLLAGGGWWTPSVDFVEPSHQAATASA